MERLDPKDQMSGGPTKAEQPKLSNKWRKSIVYVGQKINSDSKSACNATQAGYSNDYLILILILSRLMVSLITV